MFGIKCIPLQGSAVPGDAVERNILKKVPERFRIFFYGKDLCSPRRCRNGKRPDPRKGDTDLLTLPDLIGYPFPLVCQPC